MQVLSKTIGSVLVVICLGIVGASAQGHAALITATSQHSRALQLSVESNAVTTATNSATLCSAPGGDVLEAKLWMPSMGHGSAPTQLVPLGGDCLRIDHISFFMPGAWEIRVRYADGDGAVIALEVQE